MQWRNTSYSIYVAARRHLTQKARKPVKSKRYSRTLNLPETQFPVDVNIKNGQAATREKKLQTTPCFSELYDWQRRERRSGPEFVLHDGPPYANGSPHVGHALNKILKDITNRYKLLCGYRVHYTPGWDCHGLPIELNAVSEDGALKSLDPLVIRQKAQAFATAAISVQMSAYKRWGVMADWDNPYYTFDKQYQAKQLSIFYDMYKKGLIYRDYMPVYWSPSSRTALAESELEYNDSHVSKSVYVRYPLTTRPPRLVLKCGSDEPVYAIIWTTTAWTLPANKAVCFGAELMYCLCKCADTGLLYLCGESFVDNLAALLGHKLNVIDSFLGSELEGSQYHNHFTDTDLPFLPGTHVTTEKGTGLVHTAPSHGHDDYKVAITHSLNVDCYVDEEGCYTSNVGHGLMGKKVMGEADNAVIHLLGDHVIHGENHMHRYPYDWRTKLPIIIRASKQWFIDTNSLRQQALDSLSHIDIHSSYGIEGMRSMLENAPHWCISRQRVWGVPIPVFYNKHTGDPLINDETIEHIQNLILEQGSDCWWKLEHSQLLPEEICSKLSGGSAECTKGTDILDIWFDSGVSWANVLSDVGGVADLCIEGHDQFRAWFQRSLLTSIAINQQAPYKRLLVHGFAVDESGHKMSKSDGNVVDPVLVTDGGRNKEKNPTYGADVLRWWVATSHQHAKVEIGPRILSNCCEVIRTMQVRLKYLLGNLSEFKPETDSLPYNSLWFTDKYMLYMLYKYYTKARQDYEDMNYNRAALSTEKFLNSELSRFYITFTKDRCYCASRCCRDRRSSLTVQYQTLRAVTSVLAPILPHLAEEVHQHLPHTRSSDNDSSSFFHTPWFPCDPEWNNPEVSEMGDTIMSIRDTLYGKLGPESPLDFDVVICTTGALYDMLKSVQPDETSFTSPLVEMLQSSSVSLIDTPPPTLSDDWMVIKNKRDSDVYHEHYQLIVMSASRELCERCRRYTAPSTGELCARCADVVSEMDVTIS